jgi:hypothetical protein
MKRLLMYRLTYGKDERPLIKYYHVHDNGLVSSRLFVGSSSCYDYRETISPEEALRIAHETLNYDCLKNGAGFQPK